MLVSLDYSLRTCITTMTLWVFICSQVLFMFAVYLLYSYSLQRVPRGEERRRSLLQPFLRTSPARDERTSTARSNQGRSSSSPMADASKYMVHMLFQAQRTA